MKTCDLATGKQGAFATAGLKGLKPLRFTAEDQAAHPDQPMTRLVKDVLRVGRFVTSDQDGEPQPWTVTHTTLQEIERNNALAMNNGNTFNLCMTHGGPDGVVHPLDLISPIDQFLVAGDTLYVAVYVTPAQATMLRNPAMKVSVRATPSWRDGANVTYGTMLLHVAVVDLPVMGNQGPFRDLAISGGSSMDVATIVADINKILAKAGMGPLQEGLDETTFPVALSTAAAMCGEGAADDPPADEPPVLTDPVDPEQMSMAQQVKYLLDMRKSDREEIATLKSTNGKAAFEAKVAHLGAKGVPAKALETARKAAESKGWDLSYLTPLEEMGTIDMGRQGRKQASGAPPSVPGADSERKKKTPEEIAEARKALRGH